VAQASYHVPGDEASPDIRAAQAAVCSEGTALAGPDTDSLTMEWREAGGQGVHFSGLGLKEHARMWLEKLAPWLDGQLAPLRSGRIQPDQSRRLLPMIRPPRPTLAEVP